jgi:hypothetical protein
MLKPFSMIASTCEWNPTAVSLVLTASAVPHKEQLFRNSSSGGFPVFGGNEPNGK